MTGMKRDRRVGGVDRQEEDGSTAEPKTFHTVLRLDQKRDVLFQKNFGTILECIQQNIASEEKRFKAIRLCAENVLNVFEESYNKNDDWKQVVAMTLLPDITRLAYKCPFKEVREPMREFLKRHDAEKSELERRTSYFVPEGKIISVSPKEEETRHMFEDLFASRGRLSHLDQILGWHPHFLQAFTMTTEFLMKEDGALPLCFRNYLAILASSLHGCEYIVSSQEREFVFNRGDPTWLEGVGKSPKKVQGVMKLARLLAHCPWKITPDHIRDVVEGANSWTITELVQILAILCTYSSLCGLVFGMGLLPEIDMDKPSRARKIRKYYEVDTTTREQAQKNNENLFKKLGHSSESRMEDDRSDQKAIAFVDICCDTGADLKSKFPRYTGTKLQRYQDFNIKTEKLHRRQDYDWRSHAYGLMTRFYPGFSPMLNSEFDVIYNLTYKRLGKAVNVDTGPFRRAVWYYVHRLYGIENDDYNYACINNYLNRQVKMFIKKCACFPQDITRKDYEIFGYDFTDDEKCHVTLLVVEARRQASLVFGLKALGKYLSSQ